MVTVLGARASRRDEGFALFLALVVLLVVSAAMALLAAAIRFDFTAVQNLERELQATALRDRAMSETVAMIALSADHTGLKRRPVDGGWFESDVVQLSSKRLIVEVRVNFRGLQRAATASVFLPPKSPPVVSGWVAIPMRR